MPGIRPASRSVLDIYLPTRYLDDTGRQRYDLPEKEKSGLYSLLPGDLCFPGNKYRPGEQHVLII